MRLTILFLAISSFSLLLITVSDYSGSAFNVVMAVLTGILFWLFLILGYLMLAAVSRRRKEYERENRESRRKRSNNKKRPGVFCFFSNPYATAADVAMAVLTVALIVLMFIPEKSMTPKLIVVPTLIFSAHMHGILNGVNFAYTNKLSNRYKKGE